MKLVIKPDVRKHLYLTPKGVIISTSLSKAATLAELAHVNEIKLLETECPIYQGNRVFKVTIISHNGYEEEQFSTYAVGFNKAVVLAEIKHSDLIDCSTIAVEIEETPLRVMKIVRPK